MRRCVADSGYFLALAAGFWGTPASPPNSPWPAMRTGAWPRRRSTATEALPNQSMSLVRPVPAVASGGPRPPPGQARRPSRTRYRAVRSAFGGPQCCDAESKASKRPRITLRAGTPGVGIQLLGRRDGLPKALQSLNAECGLK
jgi:hypothetical protein